MARGPKDRTLDPAVERVIVEARKAGVSERTTYESLRDLVEQVPSYRDIRAVYEKHGLATRHEATLARREETVTRADDEGRKREYGPHYFEKRLAALEADRRPEALDEFDRKYLLGWFRREGVNPSDLADKEMAERLERMYAGLGS